MSIRDLHRFVTRHRISSSSPRSSVICASFVSLCARPKTHDLCRHRDLNIAAATMNGTHPWLRIKSPSATANYVFKSLYNPPVSRDLTVRFSEIRSCVVRSAVDEPRIGFWLASPRDVSCNHDLQSRRVVPFSTSTCLTRVKYALRLISPGHNRYST
jgi:hypothetical protein